MLARTFLCFRLSEVSEPSANPERRQPGGTQTSSDQTRLDAGWKPALRVGPNSVLLSERADGHLQGEVVWPGIRLCIV
jgi:hypothetical protein